MAIDVKQAIIDRLRDTQRENIDAVIDYMEKHGFFSCHCHHHHNYKGGLADHAWQTYLIAIELDLENRLYKSDVPVWGDSLAIATLLHDLCNCSGMSHIKGHGRRSAAILKELGFKLTREEFLAIRFHMSLHNKTHHPLYEDAICSKLRRTVHMADGMSAKQGRGSGAPGDLSLFQKIVNLCK